MASINLLRLPAEILRLIVDNKVLRKHDLVNLARTCTLLDSIVGPTLYRSIAIKSSEVATLDKTLSNILQGLHPRCDRLRGYVKHFECEVNVAAHVLGTTEDQDRAWEYLVDMMSEMGGPVDDIWRENSEAMLADVSRILNNLEPHQLLSLKLVWYDINYSQITYQGILDQALLQSVTARQTNITRLELVRNDVPGYLRSFQWTLPNLQYLDIIDCASEANPWYIATLIRGCKALQEARLYLLFHSDDVDEESEPYDDLYEALNTQPLTALHLTRCVFRPTLAPVLVKKTLVSLHLMKCRDEYPIAEWIISKETPLTKLWLINLDCDFATCCNMVRNLQPGLVELYLVSQSVPFESQEEMVTSAIAPHASTLRFLTLHRSYRELIIESYPAGEVGDIKLSTYEAVSRQCRLEEFSIMGYNHGPDRLFDMPKFPLSTIKRIFIYPCSASFARELFRDYKGHSEAAFFAALVMAQQFRQIYMETSQTPLLELIMIGDYKIGAKVFYVDWNGYEPTIEECLWEQPEGRITDWIRPDPWIQAFVIAMTREGLQNGKCMMVSHL